VHLFLTFNLCLRALDFNVYSSGVYSIPYLYLFLVSVPSYLPACLSTPAVCPLLPILAIACPTGCLQLALLPAACRLACFFPCLLCSYCVWSAFSPYPNMRSGSTMCRMSPCHSTWSIRILLSLFLVFTFFGHCLAPLGAARHEGVLELLGICVSRTRGMWDKRVQSTVLVPSKIQCGSTNTNEKQAGPGTWRRASADRRTKVQRGGRLKKEDWRHIHRHPGHSTYTVSSKQIRSISFEEEALAVASCC
jgi:hypothetical protein